MAFNVKGNGTQRERKRNNLLERKQYSSEKNSSTNNTRMKRILTIIAAVMTAMTPLKAQNTTTEHNLEVAKQLETFSTLYNYLDMMYVDTLNAEKVIGKGINSMLASLDPYTEYYPESETKKLKRMMTGKYGGIGSVIAFNFKEDACVIEEPYYNMPAQTAGLKKGDVIVSIDGEDMKGKGTPYVSEHLRGDAGTSFMLTIKRPGEKKLRKIKITRQTIQTPSLPYYGMLTDSIGYISLVEFTEGSAKEVRHAVIDLKRNGMQSLLLDLRNNGGGSLTEAVSILNMFVPKGTSIVKTKGKLTKANREYKTGDLPIDTIMPVVCLVNGNTASASEITCGTMQDLDRGVVMGTKTYGKGLVQTPLELPYNANMKLTTAHYYIPSGRCIQAIKYKGEGKEEVVADSLRKDFKTLHGRTVKDGGGIMPDVKVEPDSLPNIVYYLSAAGLDSTMVMMEYVVDYVSKHPTIAPARSFRVSDADYEAFKQKAINDGFKYDRESERFLKDLIKVARFEGYYDRAKPEFEALQKKLRHDLAAELDYHKDIICQYLTSEIVSCYYYQAGAIENSLQYDKQVREAVKLLRDPKRYASILSPEKTE